MLSGLDCVFVFSFDLIGCNVMPCNELICTALRLLQERVRNTPLLLLLL